MIPTLLVLPSAYRGLRAAPVRMSESAKSVVGDFTVGLLDDNSRSNQHHAAVRCSFLRGSNAIGLHFTESE